MRPTLEHPINTVAPLADPVRVRLYLHVRAATEPVTRETAAVAAGISRALAAFHLDKLVDVGLLEVINAPAVRPARPGRNPKLYGPSGVEVEVNIPPRHDDVMAAISLTAIHLGGADPVASAIQAAHEHGLGVGRTIRRALRPGKLGPERALRLTVAALNQQGYEPQLCPDPGPTQILLRNCPFRRLVPQNKDLVCNLNLALVGGILAGLDTDRLAADPARRPDHCCVQIRTHFYDTPPDNDARTTTNPPTGNHGCAATLKE
jgi:predicted ArsR family transcriptional regulator